MKNIAKSLMILTLLLTLAGCINGKEEVVVYIDETADYISEWTIHYVKDKVNKTVQHDIIIIGDDDLEELLELIETDSCKQWGDDIQGVSYTEEIDEEKITQTCEINWDQLSSDELAELISVDKEEAKNTYISLNEIEKMLGLAGYIEKTE